MPKAVTPDQVRALEDEAPIAVHIVCFDRYGRGSSDIQFRKSSVLREHTRLARLGYPVGLVDHSAAWGLDPITPEQEWEEDHIPNEEGTLPDAFDPEAQADLELHNALHPAGYRA